MRAGVVEYSVLFKYPHRKKFNCVGSGDLGGHSASWFTVVIRLLETSVSQLRTGIVLWQWDHLESTTSYSFCFRGFDVALELLVHSKYLHRRFSQIASKHIGPITFYTSTQAHPNWDFFSGNSTARLNSGAVFLGAKWLTLWLFIIPFKWNAVSSPI